GRVPVARARSGSDRGAATARADFRSRPERSASTPERGTLRGPLAARHRQRAAHLGRLGARLAVVEIDVQGIRGVAASDARHDWRPTTHDWQPMPNPLRTIGLIVGREWSWPPAFIEEVARRDQGVVAEYVKLGAPSLRDPLKYGVVIDRISHEVPFYRTWLKHALVRGVRVINSPLMWTADDKFFGATLAEQLGIRSPRTVLLPNKEYVPGIKHDESLRNLEFPLDWDAAIRHVGLPCILKDAHGGGWRD